MESSKAVIRTEDDAGPPAVDEAQLAAWRRRYEEIENAIARLIREKNLLKIMIGAGARFVNGEPVSSTLYEEGDSPGRRKVPARDVICDILKERPNGIRANDMSDELKHRNCAANISYIREILREFTINGLAKNLERGLYTWNFGDE